MRRFPTEMARLWPQVCALALLAACSEQDGTSFDSMDGIEANGEGVDTGGGVFWSEAMLHDEILKFNPEYGRDGRFQISGGRPVAISVANTNVTDLTFVRDLPLEALEITGTDVDDLTPLAGLPLQKLWAERTKVADLTPLQGVPLKNLYLSMTPVRSLAGLEGAPLEELNLAGTLVEDLTPLAGMPVQALWLNGCPVSDLSPLEDMPLIDLTLSGTDVSDVSSLAKTRLLRLYLDGLEIADLTPLAGLRLTRLIFDPRHVEKGMDELRRLENLREIGTTFSEMGNDLEPPAVFWAQMDGRLARPEPYDTSEFQPAPAPVDGSAGLDPEARAMPEEADGGEQPQDPQPPASPLGPETPPRDDAGLEVRPPVIEVEEPDLLELPGPGPTETEAGTAEP